MEIDNYRSDESKQLEAVKIGVQDLLWKLEKVDDESLLGVRKSLIEIVKDLRELRFIGGTIVVLLMLILWRVW